jgi:hypothetical protein
MRFRGTGMRPKHAAGRRQKRDMYYGDGMLGGEQASRKQARPERSCIMCAAHVHHACRWAPGQVAACQGL